MPSASTKGGAVGLVEDHQVAILEGAVLQERMPDVVAIVIPHSVNIGDIELRHRYLYR